jgi:hypothetical protein
VSAIALLCLVLLCTPVQLDCSLAALQADLLFTPVKTYCSPSSCMRSKSQLRLPCQLISNRRLVAASSPTFISAHRRLRLHCRLHLYSGISTSVVQLLQQLGPNNYLLCTSVRLIVRHHCRLESLPRRTTCGIDGRLESSSDRTTCSVTAILIIIVATLPLPNFYGIMLLLVAVWDQTSLACGIIANLIRLIGRLAASLPAWFIVLYDNLRHHCRLVAIIATFPLLWDTFSK